MLPRAYENAIKQAGLDPISFPDIKDLRYRKDEPLTFVALYLLISRIAVPRIGGILEERSRRIEGDFAAAQKAKADSEAALAAYEKSLAEARNRAQAIGNEARDKAQQEGEERRKAQEAQLNADLARRLAVFRRADRRVPRRRCDP